MGGRPPRLISDDDMELIIAAATTASPSASSGPYQSGCATAPVRAKRTKLAPGAGHHTARVGSSTAAIPPAMIGR